MAISDGALMDTSALKIDDAAHKLYKSQLYLLTGKLDSETKFFQDKISIALSDIKLLNERISQKLSQYTTEVIVASVIVNFSDNTSKEYGIWETFNMEFDESDSRRIENMSIKWDFLIKLPRYEHPLTHVLFIKITSDVRPQDVFPLLLSGKYEELDNLDSILNPIVARVDFIDPMIGREILDIVSIWVNGLDNQDIKTSSISLLKSHRKLVATTISYALSFFSVILIYSLFCLYIQNDSQPMLIEIATIKMKNLVFVFLFWYIVIVGVKKISDFIAGNIIFDSLKKYQSKNHPFNITRGDKKRLTAIREINKKAKATFILTTSLSLFWDLICVLIPKILQLFGIII